MYAFEEPNSAYDREMRYFEEHYTGVAKLLCRDKQPKRPNEDKWN